MTAAPATVGPAALRAEVVSVRDSGRHRRIGLRVTHPMAFRPGAFVSIAHGGVASARVARRSFWIHRVVPAGAQGSTVEVIVDPSTDTGAWLVSLPVGAPVSVVGPLGRPFALPAASVSCLLVGEGRAAAPLFALAERLRERGAPVHLLLGGDDAQDLLSAQELRRVVRTVTVVTSDGSVGRAASVVEVLPEVLASTGAKVVYAASSRHSTLHALARGAEQYGAWSQLALEVPHPCGTGLCHGCGVPVVGEDGVARTVRGCAEGPVFRGDRVRWVDL